jgi:hypothetical protein
MQRPIEAGGVGRQRRLKRFCAIRAGAAIIFAQVR